jgi:hypothetical protein
VKKSKKELKRSYKIRSHNMEIKTKFGPAALLMSSDGTKMGVVKAVTIQIKEGDQVPSIVYTVHGNGYSNTITENDAIGLMPRAIAQEQAATAPVAPVPAAA